MFFFIFCQSIWHILKIFQSFAMPSASSTLKNHQKSKKKMWQKMKKSLVQPALKPFTQPEPKDLFDRKHNPSHSTLRPDVLKIKAIIVMKQKFAKMPFFH